MKLKTRLAIAFLTITIIPVLVSATMVLVFANYQINTIEKTYGLSGITTETFSNSTEMLAQLTEKTYHDLEEVSKNSPEKLEDARYLEKFNKSLKNMTQ